MVKQSTGIFFALLAALTLPLTNSALADQVLSQEVENVFDGTELEQLTAKRWALTEELEKFESSLALLHNGSKNPRASDNPAVQKLVQQMDSVTRQLILVTEQEVALLQRQIVTASGPSPRVVSSTTAPAEEPSSPASLDDAVVSNPPPKSTIARNTEKVPAGDHGRSAAEHVPEAEPYYSVPPETVGVIRLRKLLEGYYSEIEDQPTPIPDTPAKIALREREQQKAQEIATTPFSATKVQLTGAEATMALAQITQRLNDPNVPDTQRDIAPICTIKTRLFNTLVGSGSRSLQPVGKSHYIAKVKLQPGETTLSVLPDEWRVQLPVGGGAVDHLITLYRPPGQAAELHVFAITDLLAQDDLELPNWLPEDIDLQTEAG